MHLEFLFFLLSMSMHELFHLFAMAIMDLKAKKLSLMPYGIRLDPGKPLSSPQLFIVSLAGPCMSLALAIIFRLLGYERLYIMNFTIAIANMVPALPLDGGHALQAAVQYFYSYMGAARLSWAISRCIGFLIYAAGIMFMADFGVWLSLFGLVILSAEQEPGQDLLSICQNVSKPRSKIKLAAKNMRDTPYSCLRYINEGRLLIVVVLDDSGAIKGTITQQQLLSAILSGQQTDSLEDLI